MSLFSLTPSPDILVDGSPSGSACCVWRDGLLQYVLTAAHVLENASPDAAIVWVGIDGAVGYGQLSKAHPYWAPVEGGVQDAGVITVNELGPFASPGSYPWGSAPVLWNNVRRAESVMICGKYSQVYATFDRRLDPKNRVESHVYGRLLQFRFDGPTTHAGDSGAPVISLPDGMLIGMHVAHHIEGRSEYSWVVSADDIMTTFGGLSGFQLRP